MKACQIFKTKKEYKIITMYKTDTGSYKLSDPIFIYPIEVEMELFANKIFESLNSSKLIVNPNISYHKDLLKKISESSYNSLYKKSKSCMLFWEDSSLIIEPQVYSDRIKALETVKDEIIVLDDVNKITVLENVTKALSKEILLKK